MLIRVCFAHKYKRQTEIRSLIFLVNEFGHATVGDKTDRTFLHTSTLRRQYLCESLGNRIYKT